MFAAARMSDKFNWPPRSEQVDRKRRGGCSIREVAVSVDAHRWQLHTISPRAADLLLCTMEPRATWGARPASRSSACSCARSRESSLPPQLATHFSFNNEKRVYYQLLWQSLRFKKIGVHFWGLLFIGVWSGSEKLFSPNCEAYLDLTNLPETWMALHCHKLHTQNNLQFNYAVYWLLHVWLKCFKWVQQNERSSLLWILYTSICSL